MDLEKPSAQRKEKILAELSERALVVKEVLSQLSNIFELPKEEAERQLNESRAGFMVGMPEAVADKIGWLQNLEEELKSLESKNGDGLTDEEEGDEDDVAFVANELAMEEVREQISGLRADSDVAVYTSLLAVYDGLEAKMQMVANYNRDGLEQITKTMGYAAEDFTEIDQNAVSVVHIVKDEAWRGRQNSRGSYQRGTPYIYIRQSRREEEGYKKTLRHEQKHLLLDGVESIKDSNPVSMVRTRLTTFRRTIDSGAGEFFKARFAEYFTNQTFDLILNNLHNEFLAEYKTASDTFFGESKINSLVLMREFIAGDYDSSVIEADARRAAGSLSTAGHRFEEVIKTLSDFQAELVAGNYSDQALQLGEFVDRLKVRFVEIIRSLRDSLSHAYSLNNDEDVVPEIEALVHILPPSKYEHILTYLQSKYPIDTQIDEDDFVVDKNRPATS